MLCVLSGYTGGLSKTRYQSAVPSHSILTHCIPGWSSPSSSSSVSGGNNSSIEGSSPIHSPLISTTISNNSINNSNTNMLCSISQKLFSELLTATAPSYPTAIRLAVVEVTGHLFQLLSSSLSQSSSSGSSVNPNNKLSSYQRRKNSYANKNNLNIATDLSGDNNKNTNSDVNDVYDMYYLASRGGIRMLMGILDDGSDEVRFTSCIHISLNICIFLNLRINTNLCIYIHICVHVIITIIFIIIIVTARFDSRLSMRSRCASR